MRNISDLHPCLIEKVKKLKSECEKKGLIIGIGECLRTVEEQNKLYEKGRTLPGKIVTNAKGTSFSSMHQWGVAVDFYRADGKGAYNTDDNFFGKVGEIGRNLGLLWGGDWKNPVDLPHFQLPDWGSTASRLKRQYKTPEQFMKTWEDNSAMTAEEKKKFDELAKEVDRIKASSEKTYKYTADIPDWARPTVQKLLDNGIFAGMADDNLNLSETMMRMLVINDRAGVYDKEN